MSTKHVWGGVLLGLLSGNALMLWRDLSPQTFPETIVRIGGYVSIVMIILLTIGLVLPTRNKQG
jgi:hypothetical protein